MAFKIELLIIGLVLNLVASEYCHPGLSCWPNSTEVQALYDALDPSASRMFAWTKGTPRIGAVPILSQNDQPLYGLGLNGMKPLYVRSETDRKNTCFLPSSSPYVSEFCMAAIRNVPSQGWTPGFVVFPLTSKQVQTAVNFATKHNLCIMVAGTGHDFMNRHSCSDGIFIRTTLMKDTAWDLASTAEAPNGKVKFGAGIVFNEAHVSAAQQNRVISSGWASTVGVIGWSIGGGHGPFSPAFGLGVDNILEVEIVLANGTIAVANSTQNVDLYWAIRGGGGSTWGVITSITIRAHPIPAGGFTKMTMVFGGCNTDVTGLHSFIDNHVKTIQDLDTKFGGLTFFTPSNTPYPNCPEGIWSILVVIVYQGDKSDTAFTNLQKNLTAVLNTPVSTDTKSYANWGIAVTEQDLEPIIPVDIYTPPGIASGVASVTISREVMASGRIEKQLKEKLAACKLYNKCNRQEFYFDITGAINSPRSTDVSVSEGFRNGLVHWVVGGLWTVDEMESYYALGNNSYFSESARLMKGDDSWKTRYWGSNVNRLEQIKQKYDPNAVFNCYHCVGSTSAVNTVNFSTASGTGVHIGLLVSMAILAFSLIA
eukprot:Colp12_sorted_trinity150504_noHs@3484